MSDRPNALTVYVSDQQLAYLEEGAKRMRALGAASDTPALAAMTSADMAAMLVEIAHKQYLNDQNA